LLGQLESNERIVIADMEAGVGTLTRMEENSLDLALLVTKPSPKSIEVAGRAAQIIAERKIGPVLAIANRSRDQADLDRVRAALDGIEAVAVPDDPSIMEADRLGIAPFDLAPDSPAAQAVAALARRIAPGRSRVPGS
jgi:CO dehydrogenase maturation factor